MQAFSIYSLFSLQSSAVEQVLDILMDILSWEIAEVEHLLSKSKVQTWRGSTCRYVCLFF